MALPDLAPTEPDPVWERQPGEPARAFAAFCVYRDMGPQRSIRKAEPIIRAAGNGARKTVHQWSSKWGWASRAPAYDAMLDRERVAERVGEVRKMEDRHAQISLAGLSGLAMPLVALGKPRKLADGRFQDRIEELEGMETGQLLRLAAHTARSMARLVGVERLSRGEATEIVQTPSAASPVPPVQDETGLLQMLQGLEQAGLLVTGTFEIGAQKPEPGADGLPILEAP